MTKNKLMELLKSGATIERVAVTKKYFVVNRGVSTVISARLFEGVKDNLELVDQKMATRTYKLATA